MSQLTGHAELRHSQDIITPEGLQLQ